MTGEEKANILPADEPHCTSPLYPGRAGPSTGPKASQARNPQASWGRCDGVYPYAGPPPVAFGWPLREPRFRREPSGAYSLKSHPDFPASRGTPVRCGRQACGDCAPGGLCAQRGRREGRAVLPAAGALGAEPGDQQPGGFPLVHQPLPRLRVRLPLLLRPLHPRVHGAGRTPVREQDLRQRPGRAAAAARTGGRQGAGRAHRHRHRHRSLPARRAALRADARHPRKSAGIRSESARTVRIRSLHHYQVNPSLARR